MTVQGASLGPPNARRLRVLTYLHSFDPGGVERVALRLNAAWRTLGVETVLVVDRDVGLSRGLAADLPYIVLEAGDARRGRLGRLIRQLPGIIARERPDILFCAGNTYSLAAVVMRLMLGGRCPPIIAKISNDLARRDQSPLLRLGYHRWLWLQGRLIDHFVGMATPMRAEITGFVGVPTSRVSIINDPVLFAEDVRRLSAVAASRRASGAGRRFLAIGRLLRQKNFALLLAAFARMARADDRLTILGDGPDREALTQAAAALGIAHQVMMPGFTDPIDPWLAAADIFVMSSDYEGVPAVIIEAIAAGLTIVATDCSVSMRALTGDGRFGTLVPVGDVTALASAMAAATPAPDRASAIHDHVSQFTVEQGARDYLAVMTSLAHARSVQGRLP